MVAVAVTHPPPGKAPHEARLPPGVLPEEELDPNLRADEEKLLIEDDTPVDNILSEKQMRLLTEALYASWAGPPPGPGGAPRPFVALANVGLYGSLSQSPLVPDVLVSLDVHLPQELRDRSNRVYFVWRFGKLPELVLEIVSNREGDELSDKLGRYAALRIQYYVVYDPLRMLGETPLHVFELVSGAYQPMARPFLPLLALGLRLWDGQFEDLETTWLRWVDAGGDLLLTGTERARRAETQLAAEKERAEARLAAEKERAEAQLAAEKEKRERLAAKLRALGIDPGDG